MCGGGGQPISPFFVNPIAPDDNVGNTHRDTLGPYRGINPTFHNAHPVLFDQESSSPMGGLGLLAGALTPDKGGWGTAMSKSYQHGKTRLIIYGDPKTGKPSSWELLEWLPNGKKMPNTNTELYDWKLVPNARAALAKDGFYESYRKFVNGPDSEDDEAKNRIIPLTYK